MKKFVRSVEAVAATAAIGLAVTGCGDKAPVAGKATEPEPPTAQTADLRHQAYAVGKAVLTADHSVEKRWDGSYRVYVDRTSKGSGAEPDYMTSIYADMRKVEGRLTASTTQEVSVRLYECGDMPKCKDGELVEDAGIFRSKGLPKDEWQALAGPPLVFGDKMATNTNFVVNEMLGMAKDVLPSLRENLK